MRYGIFFLSDILYFLCNHDWFILLALDEISGEIQKANLVHGFLLFFQLS